MTESYPGRISSSLKDTLVVNGWPLLYKWGLDKVRESWTRHLISNAKKKGQIRMLDTPLERYKHALNR